MCGCSQLLFSEVVRQQRAVLESRLHVAWCTQVPLFASLTPAQRSQLCTALKPMHVSGGTAIVRAGDVGDTFYVVEAGACSVVNEAQQARPEGHVRVWGWRKARQRAAGAGCQRPASLCPRQRSVYVSCNGLPLHHAMSGFAVDGVNTQGHRNLKHLAAGDADLFSAHVQRTGPVNESAGSCHCNHPKNLCLERFHAVRRRSRG